MRDTKRDARAMRARIGFSKTQKRGGAAAMIGCAVAVLVSASAPVLAQPKSNPGTKIGSVTGRPLPRFASLKASKINLRNGPGTVYPTSWVFSQIGLPVEIINESEAWRQIRDSEGTEGWVLRTLLSGRRTAQVMPWQAKGETGRPHISITERPTAGSRAVALVEAGVVANIQSCDGSWCYVGIDNFQGFMPQDKLWGVYENERIR